VEKPKTIKKIAFKMSETNLHCKPTTFPVDEEIVISGMAGRFPKSANVAEFFDNLYNKVKIFGVM
jgi:hypothetical protein